MLETVYLVLSFQQLFYLKKIFFSSLSFSLDIFYWPVFLFTNPAFFYVQHALKLLNSSRVYFSVTAFFSPSTILFFTTDSSSLMKFSILSSIFLDILIIVSFKSVSGDLNIWICGPSIDLFLLSIYFPWSFTLVCLVIFYKFQILRMKNWTPGDVIF